MDPTISSTHNGFTADALTVSSLSVSQHLRDQENLHHLNVLNAVTNESLVNNALELIGGDSKAAQKFLNQIDLYTVQKFQQQQQQHEHQQQQQHRHLLQNPECSLNNLNNHLIAETNNNSNNNHINFNISNNNNNNNSYLNFNHQQQQQQEQSHLHLHSPVQAQFQNLNSTGGATIAGAASSSSATLNVSPPRRNYNFLQQQQERQHLNKQHSMPLLSSPSPSPSAFLGSTSASASASTSAFSPLPFGSPSTKSSSSSSSLSTASSTTSPTPISSAAAKSATALYNLNGQNHFNYEHNNNYYLKHNSNHRNNYRYINNNSNKHYHMDLQQQKITMGSNSNANNAPIEAGNSFTTPSALASGISNNNNNNNTNNNNNSNSAQITGMMHHQQQQQQQQQQQKQSYQHHHHHHQHHHPQHHCMGSGVGCANENDGDCGADAANNIGGFNKSCWCSGESVCSGVEIEIENNNNNNHNYHGESTYHMKILVPAVASGAIIGKGGETIASLQKDTGARVKMSKSHDFYPGTTERVCLITGTVEGIMSVLDFIMDKIREKPDLTTKIIDAEAKQQQDRDKQVKILVPNSTAGMIIGKGGAFIKQIKEESGSYVQISQKPKDISLQERCITVIGDKENNKNACKMILSKIVEDPQSGTCLNVSYADINGPVANFNPTGSPYATNQNAINSSTASLNSTLGSAMSGAATAAGLLVNGTGGINLSLNLGAPNPAPNLTVATQLLEHIKIAMRGSGYSETATNEVCAALAVLAKYGVLGMGVGVPHAANGAHTTLGSFLGVSALDQSSAAATAGNVFGAVGQVNLEQYAAAAAAAASRPTQSQLEAAAAAAQFDPFRHLSSATQAATPVSLNNNSFGLTAATGATGATAGQTLSATAAHSLSGLSKSPTPGDLGAKDSKNVEIPEVIVGAILGPNGRSLVEIQHVSGANVQISKKGIFAPGTRNRIVTITGQPSAIAKAQFLIEQKINEEETKRARQIPLTTVVN